MEEKQIESPIYSKEEQEYVSWMQKELRRMSEDREQPRDEFNGKSYSDFWDDCERVGEARILPKKNANDDNLTSGTTKNKINTQVSALLQYNFTPEVIAYDNNNIEIQKFGTEIEKMLFKSRQIEQFDELRPILYRNGSKHGTFFAKEIWDEQWETVNTIASLDVSDFSKIKWTTKKIKKEGIARIVSIPGKSIYLGNINEYFLWKQPRIAIVSVVPYDIAQLVFGTWSRWKNVPKKRKETVDISDSSGLDEKWNLTSIQDDQVEIIEVQDQVYKTVNFLLNGVLMLPVGFPLEAISPTGTFTIAKGDMGSSVEDFAYSTPLPADMVVEQDTYDQLLKAFVSKTKFSVKPSMTIGNSAQSVTDAIFDPGYILKGIKADDIKPIFPNYTGVSNAEINVFNILKDIMNESSIDPVQSGDQSGNITATEYQGRLKQQMMKLGSSILGVINFHKQIDWLRVFSIKRYWTEKVDYRVNSFNKLEEVYRSFSLKGHEDEQGFESSIVRFDPNKTKILTSKEIYEEEKALGGKTRIVYIDPQKFRDLIKYVFISIIPKQTESTELEKMMLINDVTTIANLGKMPNLDNFTKTYCSMAKLDYDSLYGQTVQSNNQLSSNSQPNNKIASQLEVKEPAQPSINTLNNV